MAVSLEQATINALARYIQTALDKGVVTPLVTDDATDAATALVLANALRAALNTHLADVGAHVQVDAVNPVTADTADDLDTTLALLIAVKAAYNAHQTQAGVHLQTFEPALVTTDDATDEDTAVALANALKTAINAHLLTSLARVVISDHWPEPSLPLPPKAITILPGGPRQDEYLSAQATDLVSMTDTTVTYRWELAYVSQPLQLDVWTHYRGDRDDIVAALEPLFRAGAAALGLDADFEDPSTEFQLELGDGWEGTIADYLFSGAHITDADESIKRSEYRAMFQGAANSKLTVTQTSARVAQLTIQRIPTP